MARSSWSRIARRLALLLAAMLIAVPLAATGTAEAQQLVRRCNGLFDCLFGARSQPAARQTPAQERTRSGARRSAKPRAAVPDRSPASSASHRSASVAPEPEPAVEKLDNARVVLVVGDFLAGGLAEGLEEAYADSPGVRVVDRTNGSSGFVRDDFYDWNASIGPIVDEEKPAVVVVMIGSNDRQQLVVGSKREDPRSDAWTKEYLRRVEAFAATVAQKKIPLVWTGLPPFKSQSMSSDMLAFNDIYKQTAEAVAGQFVDIWDGFVDANGNFTFTGPDMNGQTVRLRGSDGINLTRPAKRKVAFYVEKPLSKILGSAVSPDASDATIAKLPDLMLSPAVPGAMDRIAPISFADPDLDGGAELLGASVATRPTEPKTDAQKLVIEGIAPEPQPGRADYFSAVPPAPGPAGADSQTTTAIGR